MTVKRESGWMRKFLAFRPTVLNNECFVSQAGSGCPFEPIRLFDLQLERNNSAFLLHPASYNSLSCLS
jgi:hypothetical protein